VRDARRPARVRGAAAAQRLLSATTTPERADAVIGDLSEQAGHRGSLWFWLAVSRIAIANVHEVLNHHSRRTVDMTDRPHLLITIWRRKYLVLTCTIVAAVIAGTIAASLPSRYLSTAILAIESSSSADEAESAISDTVKQAFNDPTLESILRDSDGSRTSSHDADSPAVLHRMREDIRVEMLGANVFRIGYRSTSPRVAQQVTSRLAAAIIEENLRRVANPVAAAALRSVISLVANRESIGEATPPLSISGEIELSRNSATINARNVRSRTLTFQLDTKEPVSVSLQLNAKVPGGLVLAELLQGSTMRLVSSATLPTSPYAPNRRRIVVTGAMTGLVLGLLLAGSARPRSYAHVDMDAESVDAPRTTDESHES
jgi:hypothetical protein